jgi:peptide/nickel transport system substrate-binding protein
MRRLAALGVALTAVAGCREPATCDDCDTLVIAVTGEPTSLIPPLVRETVGRDITDQIYERLATLKPGGSPADPAAYRPGLAARWERPDSTSIRFVLRSGAAWHDGRPVTAGDVVFSFAAFTDPELGAAADALIDRVTVTAEGDTAVVVRFDAPDGEMMYDATYGVRILPAHLWSELPRAQCAADTSLARIVGSGPFRLTSWTRGQSLMLERAAAASDGIQRMVWRFAGDQDAAVNLLLAGQADLIETVTSPSAREQVSGDSLLREIPYPSAVQGYVGLRHVSANGAPDPILGNRAVRRALVLALDRGTLIRAVIGPDAVVPPGPISRAMWIWDDAIATLPYDTTQAARLLDSAGFARAADGTRRRGATRLTVDILSPEPARSAATWPRASRRCGGRSG